MFIISKKFKSSFKTDQKGMTLIELLVVVAIITILSAITIFDYNSFRSAVSTQNIANDIALSIRKAQSYSIGVKGNNDIYNFSKGYGISFVANNPGSNILSGSNKSFIIFRDFSNEGQYDFPASPTAEEKKCLNPTKENECMEILSISGADKISAIYYKYDNGNTKVTDGRVDIVFKRPNPDAIFCHKKHSSDQNCKKDKVDLSFVQIEVSNGLTGTKEITRTITVWNTGQISVDSQ